MDVIHIMACFTVFAVCYPELVRDRLAEHDIDPAGVSFFILMVSLVIWGLFCLLAFGALVQIEGCMDPLPQRGIDTVEVPR